MTSFSSLSYGVKCNRDKYLCCGMRVTGMIVKKNTHFRLDWLFDWRADVYWEVWSVKESRAM